MADDAGLLAIDVDVDDYAESAAGDAPNVPRTFQSETDFHAQKASYSAKVDDGNLCAKLIKAVPKLADVDPVPAERAKLSKKEYQLLGYATGEMYHDRRYAELLDFCDRIEERCEVDARLRESLDRWRTKARVKMEMVVNVKEAL